MSHLHLLSAPTSIRLTHIRRGLDGRHELESRIPDTDETDDGAPDDLPDRAAVEDDGADEDVEDAASEEGEQERCVAGDLGRDLEFQETVDWCGYWLA